MSYVAGQKLPRWLQGETQSGKSLQQTGPDNQAFGFNCLPKTEFLELSPLISNSGYKDESTMQEFEFYSPRTLEEVCQALADPGGHLIAGGTDVIPQMRSGRLRRLR